MRTRTIIALTILGLLLLNLLHFRGGLGQEKSRSMETSLASSWFWIQGYGAWLEKDERRLIDSYRFATALNPCNLSYWRLATQTIAFDLSVWKGSEARDDYGRKALDFFESSRPYFRDDPVWFQTGAFIAESAITDPSLALAYLEEGVALNSFPYLLGKSYARLLMESGDEAKVLSFLKTWQPQLKVDPYPERRREIEDWILSLEKEMNSPHSP